MSYARDFDRPRKAPITRIDVEIILDDISYDHLLVRTDEDACPINIPRFGTKLTMTEATLPYATLSLSENKAIAYSLV